MSAFIGDARRTLNLAAKDERLHDPERDRRQARLRGGSRHVAGNEGFYSEFWPGNRGFVGDGGLDIAMLQGPGGRRTQRFAEGNASRVGFPGTTRDAYGAPLAGATVILHRTSTRELVSEVVSDANGNFLAHSHYVGEGHYLVFHKTSSPTNVYGATDNTIIGA